MSDAELNFLIHTEVEGYNREPIPGRSDCYTDKDGNPCLFKEVPNYCIDPAWCVAMMNEHRLSLEWSQNWYTKLWTWDVAYGPLNSDGGRDSLEDESLTRAVALAVLEIHRRKV